MKTYADRIKMLRTRNKMSQDALAGILGLSRSTIGMYETGQREPDFETLEAIADYFNVDMDYLLGRSDVERLGDIHLTVTSDDPQIARILAGAQKLNAQGLAKLGDYAEDLADNPKYRKPE